MTDIQPYQAPANVPSPVPSPAEFDLILRQADVISNAGIVPNAYRRQPANVVVASLTGRTFGWDALTAMRNIHVIEGTASLKPEAMLGMIRGRGHSVSIDRKADGVVVTGKRADTGDTMTVSFTFEDAYRAGLATRGQNGMPSARGQKGIKPWEAYPVDMCQWRAIGALARGLFGDVVLGLGYTPEELGATVDATGNVIEGSVVEQVHPAPAPAPERDWKAEVALIDTVEVARGYWREAKNAGAPAWVLDTVASVARKLQAAEQAAPAPEAAPEPDEDGVVDAELVDDTADQAPDAAALVADDVAAANAAFGV